MNTYVITEGATEEKVIAQLKKKLMIEKSFKVLPGQGKDQINKRIRDFLGPELERGVRGLVLEDLDEHQGKTVERIAQSVEGGLRRMFQESGDYEATPVALQPHPDYAGVYTWESSNPDVRLALHIATYRWSERFIKSTIDDYVLTLALCKTTVQGLLDKLRNKKKWTITPQQVISKVTSEIPALLIGNGIHLQEAKDYVYLYIAVLQEHISSPVFAGKILAHAEPNDIRETFAPLLAAAEFVGG